MQNTCATIKANLHLALKQSVTTCHLYVFELGMLREVAKACTQDLTSMKKKVIDHEPRDILEEKNAMIVIHR